MPPMTMKHRHTNTHTHALGQLGLLRFIKVNKVYGKYIPSDARHGNVWMKNTKATAAILMANIPLITFHTQTHTDTIPALPAADS